ncbi:proline iminopeptidase-family hydrolase [Paenibacillus barengoltzii]|uniref:Proline iminopeptidase n=1 Tax=Paenibacillus barengoltzii J12 TaxID=935846 RepID=A0ABY1LV01_9BACL|nr:proline iminopeptidase-family hydrolase [Paenibacillus barengoltzii]SMF09757.1 proline iminopeptidase [Paenibacillus barengoltzii J12]
MEELTEQEGYIDVPGGRVWFVRVGTGSKTPLVVLHGGPGGTHHSLKAGLQDLADERPVIFYDQLGSGNSERPGDPSLWQLDRFVEELECVRQALNLDEIHLLGHSWGTMLAATYLIKRKPKGVRSITFSSPCLSAERWKRDADVLISKLPQEVREAIVRNEERGTTDSEEYRNAVDEYYKRHLIRIDPLPEVVIQNRAKSNSEVYLTMWGPSEFCPTGNLKTFDCTSELNQIAIPALFVCGRYDEATPESTQYYQSLVPHSQFHVFENSAHYGYLEDSDEYKALLRSFTNKVELSLM